MNAFTLPAAALFICVSAAAAVSAAGMAARGDGDPMRRLAVERGCTICHQEQPGASGSDGIIAHAPSWREIATRYRGHADAEEQLTRIVVGGSDPDHRHWKNRAAFTSMLPNAVETTPEEARALVRWILSSHE